MSVHAQPKLLDNILYNKFIKITNIDFFKLFNKKNDDKLKEETNNIKSWVWLEYAKLSITSMNHICGQLYVSRADQWKK